MQNTSTYLRKSDRQLVNQAYTSFAIILFLAAVIAGLYFLTPQKSYILGTQTINTSGQ